MFFPVQVPVSRWGRLDASAPYEEFAEGGSSPQVISYVISFSPAIVMVVDWSALELYRRLKQQVRGDSMGPLSAPMVYLNYRVFSRTAIGDELSLVSRYQCPMYFFLDFKLKHLVNLCKTP